MNEMTWVYPGHKKAHIFEMLSHLQHIPSQQEKIKFLQEYTVADAVRTYAMKMFIQLLADPNMKLDLPPGTPTNKDGTPAYKTCGPHLDKAPASFLSTYKKFTYFRVGAVDRIQNDIKRERIFLQFLEGYCDGDANFVIALKDKNYKALGLTEDLVYATFPGWLPVREKKVAVVEATKPAVTSSEVSTGEQQVKRGRGRPRKHPLPG